MMVIPPRERRPPTERDKTKMCKQSMVVLTQFIKLGRPLPPFETAILLRQDPTGACSTLGRTKHEVVVPFVREWLAANCPPSAFETIEDIQAWSDHRGLAGASYENRLWFRMVSEWWAPTRVADSP